MRPFIPCTALHASTLCEVVDNPQLHGDIIPGSSCVHGFNVGYN